MLLDLISGVSGICWAVLLFPILKPHNKNLTLGFTVIKFIAGLMIIVASIILLPVIIKAETSITLLLEIHDWIHVILGYIFGINALIFFILLYQSKLVPRFISVWGLIASVFLLVVNLLSMIARSPSMIILYYLPVILNEIFLAIWLIVKGFNEEAIMLKFSETNYSEKNNNW
ncbi:MAG: DUF4386 domain-containing protein [Candidatus Hermodarchaeota archaeon]